MQNASSHGHVTFMFMSKKSNQSFHKIITTLAIHAIEELSIRRWLATAVDENMLVCARAPYVNIIFWLVHFSGESKFEQFFFFNSYWFRENVQALAMICSQFAKKAQTSVLYETHPEFMECSVCIFKVKQITMLKNPLGFDRMRHEHFDRKYGWASLVWNAHLYFIFFCTHKQFETRIYAYLLFHGRRSDGCMQNDECGASRQHTKCNCFKDTRCEESSERTDNELNLYMWMWNKDTRIKIGIFSNECENLLRVEYEIKQSLWSG